jgi:hypothetical protein
MTDQAAPQQQPPKQPPKVASKHGKANEIIGKFRALAVEIAALGDEATTDHDRADEAERHEGEVLAGAEQVDTQLQEWTVAIEDYRRGILDRNELFTRTVGHG